MKLARRQIAGGAALPLAMAHRACAQGYPTRPVRLIAGIAAGGSQDIAARLIAQRLSEGLG
jgi:tripartite-type tricarboxylate transporter receptor subunit TctC